MLLHFSYLTLFLLAQTIDSTWHRCRRVTLAYEALSQLVGVHHQTWRIDTPLHTFLPIVRWYTFKLESTYLYLLFEYVFNCIKRKYPDVVITRKVFCDLEYVGRNYFAFVVLISRKIRLISHNSREIIHVFYFTGL